ncbi:MAG: adenylate kinase [Alphaproteobacteria bacterium]|nr:adenylate kinase [Alphaproteobacteria bacterium]MCW5740621.1 adenylate kinase [Alphaproteobacteria bacterium]
MVGTTGSGKSRLAERLAPLLDAEHVELDALFWTPGWRPVLAELFRQRVDAATSGGRWIVAGNYGQVRDLVWGRADTLVWLDFNLPLVLRRLALRTVRRVVTREELWNTGNRESLRGALGRQSILRYALRTHRANRARFAADLADPRYGHLAVHRFDDPRALQQWVERLKAR